MNTESLWKRWLRGMLNRMRENTKGGDGELLELMGKLDRGELRWTGSSINTPKSKKPR